MKPKTTQSRRWQRRFKGETKPRRTRMTPVEEALCDRALARIKHQARAKL